MKEIYETTAGFPLSPDQLYSLVAKGALSDPKLQVLKGDEISRELRVKSATDKNHEYHLVLRVWYEAEMSNVRIVAMAEEDSEELVKSAAINMQTILNYIFQNSVPDEEKKTQLFKKYYVP